MQQAAVAESAPVDYPAADCAQAVARLLAQLPEYPVLDLDLDRMWTRRIMLFESMRGFNDTQKLLRRVIKFYLSTY